MIFIKRHILSLTCRTIVIQLKRNEKIRNSTFRRTVFSTYLEMNYINKIDLGEVEWGFRKN